MTDLELASPPSRTRAARDVAPAAVRASSSTAVWQALRALVVVGVLALVLRGNERAAQPGRVVELRDDPGTDAVRLVRDVFAERAPSLLVRRSTASPDALVLDALAAAGTAAPLLTALPTPPVVAQVSVPRLVAERAAAVTFDITGTAGSRQRVELRDAAGSPLDSAVVQLDGAGRASGAFRVRPTREGWHEWWIATGSSERSAGGWALSARVPRVLVAAGPPDAESRFVVRALEEAGAEVDVRQPLGRGLTPGGAAAALPASADALRQIDVVLVLPGAAIAEAQRRALARFAEEYGGGVLIAARDPLLPRLGLADGPQPDAREIDPATLHWDMPAELTALPAVAAADAAVVRGIIEPMSSAAGATVVARVAGGSAAIRADSSVAARTAGAAAARAAAARAAAATANTHDAAMILRAAGRGRAAALGVRESWRWRVAAGKTDEHGEFWRSLVDWLAPVPQPLLLEFATPLVAVGLPVRAELEYGSESSDSGVSQQLLLLRRPSGAVEPLAVQRVGGAAQRAHIAFVPADTGVHTLVHDGDVVGAVRAIERGTHESAALLALTARASGGRALTADALQDTLRVLGASGAGIDWRSIACGLLLLAALADWASRRLRGMA